MCVISKLWLSFFNFIPNTLATLNDFQFYQAKITSAKVTPDTHYIYKKKEIEISMNKKTNDTIKLIENERIIGGKKTIQ